MTTMALSMHTRVAPARPTSTGAAARKGSTVGNTAPARRRASSAIRALAPADDLGNSASQLATDARVSTRRVALTNAAAVLVAAVTLPACADEEVVVAVVEAVAVEAVAVEAVATTPAPPPPPQREVKTLVPLTTVQQPTMAYEFSYPTTTKTGEPIRWAPSRVRERYSKAEPMSPDARQRIVYEFIAFKGPMTCTVTVGPAPPKLANKDPTQWQPKQVAEAVLADRATGRIATGQKVSLAEVEYAREEVIDGTTYVYYEYISQGSPNLAERESTTFRHSLGVTARRGNFLYTYTVSAPETLWDSNQGGFEQGIDAFRLTEPNKKKFREPGNEGLFPPLPF